MRASWIISVISTTYCGVCTIWRLLLYGPGSITSGSPRVMQRSCRLRFSYESAGPWVRASARRAAARSFASAVRGGIFPSGGSTIKEVRAVLTGFFP